MTFTQSVRVVGKDGTNRASAANPLPVDAIVTVDSMTINAEMKVDTGHDLYRIASVTATNDTIKCTFAEISGLSLLEIQSVENKTVGWIFNTAGATLATTTGTTTLTLSAAAQETGYVNFATGDILEIVYRDTSRFTNKTQMSNITDGTTEAVIETTGTKKALNVNLTDGTNDMPTMDVVARRGLIGLTDGVNDAAIDPANTARTVATVIVATQNVDATGKVTPAGEAVGNAPFAKITDGTETALITAGGSQNVLDDNSGSIKTAVEKIDDLQGALKSIDTDELITRITDSAGIEINPAKEGGNLATISTAVGATTPQAYGTDAAGVDAYTTVVTASAERHHMMISLQGANDAIVSIDSGVTEHFYIPANSSHVFDNILIANAATIQGKNASAGNNYAHLNITVW